MKRLTSSILSFLIVLGSFATQAQSDVEMADGMRAEGKIYVVVAIILIILTGLIAYLVILDRKVTKLEKLVSGKNK
jgi:CcmD family protein